MLSKIFKRFPNLEKILYNNGWLLLDKVFRMGVGMLLGVWIARYLGPESYGKLNYVIAYVALVGSFTSLGQDGIVVRELINEKRNTDEIISTAFIMQFVAGLVAYLMSIFLILFLRPNQTDIFWMVVLVGFTLILRAMGVIKYWYEAQVQSKYIVWIEGFLFLIFSGLRVMLILENFGVFAFVWLGVFESIINLFAYYVLFRYHESPLSIRHSRWNRAKILLKNGWMLLLSGLAVILYMRIDQIMIGQMMSDDAVGVYTAAVKISEVWYFIPMTIVSSIFPAILNAKQFDQNLYMDRLRLLHSFMFILSIMIAIPMSFLSDSIIALLFGDRFNEASVVLSIHIWAGVFVFLGVASSRYYLTENLQRGELYKSLLGCFVNVVLNYLLIPIYGIKGAAIATVISQFVASVLFNFLFKRTREIFFIQLESLMFWRLFHRFNELRKSLT